MKQIHHISQRRLTMNDKLTSMRRRHGLTQKQLSRKLGISPLSIVLWEYGDRSPAVQHIERLCQVYCCQPKEIGYNQLVSPECIDDMPIEETPPSFSHT